MHESVQQPHLLRFINFILYKTYVILLYFKIRALV